MARGRLETEWQQTSQFLAAFVNAWSEKNVSADQMNFNPLREEVQMEEPDEGEGEDSVTMQDIKGMLDNEDPT